MSVRKTCAQLDSMGVFIHFWEAKFTSFLRENFHVLLVETSIIRWKIKKLMHFWIKIKFDKKKSFFLIAILMLKGIQYQFNKWTKFPLIQFLVWVFFQTTFLLVIEMLKMKEKIADETEKHKRAKKSNKFHMWLQLLSRSITQFFRWVT